MIIYYLNQITSCYVLENPRISKNILEYSYQIKKIEGFYFLIENYLDHVLSFTQPPRRKLLRSNVLFIIFIETSFRFMSNHHQVKINNII